MKRWKQTEIEAVVNILKNDGVVSVPTDTVYGICARISETAKEHLVQVKNRPATKPFSIMCADEAQIEQMAIVDERARRLIRCFMPGPVTLLLKKRPEVPAYVNNGLETIAVRMATSKILEACIRKTGSPLFMSSANQSGKSSCKNLEEIERACPMLDGMLEGEVTFGEASTIIDCTLDEIRIVRVGPISAKAIKDALEKKEMEEPPK